MIQTPFVVMIQVNEQLFINPAQVLWFEIDAYANDEGGITPQLLIQFAGNYRSCTGQDALTALQKLHPQGDLVARAPALPEGEPSGYTIHLYGEDLLLSYGHERWDVEVMSRPRCFAVGQTLAEALVNAGNEIAAHKDVINPAASDP